MIKLGKDLQIGDKTKLCHNVFDDWMVDAEVQEWEGRKVFIITKTNRMYMIPQNKEYEVQE